MRPCSAASRRCSVRARELPQRFLISDVATLPVVLTSKEAAELLGVSIDHLWSMAREGNAPVEPLKLGRSYRWPTARLLALLGLGPDADEPPVSTGGSVTDLVDAAKHPKRSPS
jgi:predicted DNA-binding transcriptional regulator AlpA